MDFIFFLSHFCAVGPRCFLNGASGKVVDSENSPILGPQVREIAFLRYRPLFCTAFVCDVCRFDLVCEKK